MKSMREGVLFGISFVIALGGIPAAVAGGDAPSGRVTFTRDILPILQENCQICHRPSGGNLSGMVAPMSLMTYEDVRPWAKSISTVLKDKYMPPWFASPEFHGVFLEERTLNGEEVATILKWIDTGAARGNPADAPEPVAFQQEGWMIGEPDLILTFPEPFWVPDDITDIQPSIVIELTEDILPEDRWVQAVECRPGSDIVHHMGAYTTSPIQDDPLSGGKLIGTAPGDGPDIWPEGYGKLLRKGTTFRFTMHYHKEPGPGTGKWDRSSVGIRFADKPVDHVVRSAAISRGNFEVPPLHNEWFVGASRTFRSDTTIISMMPHMHFRGKSARYEVIYPNGDRETILEVPLYDYNWQRTYTFREPVKIPAGSRVEVMMTFDNSAENPFNPDPSQWVRSGGMTDDEMAIGWMDYTNTDRIQEFDPDLDNSALLRRSPPVRSN